MKTWYKWVADSGNVIRRYY